MHKAALRGLQAGLQSRRLVAARLGARTFPGLCQSSGLIPTSFVPRPHPNSRQHAGPLGGWEEDPWVASAGGEPVVRSVDGAAMPLGPEIPHACVHAGPLQVRISTAADLDRFRTELALLAGLSGTPGIVQLLGTYVRSVWVSCAVTGLGKGPAR